MRNVAAFLVIAWTCTVVRADPLDPKSVEFFEQKVRPLLADKCYSCHSAEAQKNKKLKAGLLLDTRAATLTGGDSGPALVPGKPDESLLIKAVRYTDSDLKMPPKTKLSDAEIRVLEEWVKLGAPDPRRDDGGSTAIKPQPVDIAAGRQHWSMQPVRDPVPPKFTDDSSLDLQSDLDRFVREPQQARGLKPPRRADKRTLIRRATYDLTGLPPTPAEIDAFLADTSPQAFEKVIDRLLASPRYGERWGRHWLDVVRYADSNGLDENVCHGNAWRYRDYVIAAFNEDKPFDQFVMEQIAGDLMGEEKGLGPRAKGQEAETSPALVIPNPQSEIRNPKSLTALGFLAMGPKVLAEVDKTKMEMDIIDEQIDTIGRAMLGLTLGCARCHDHKFDPITMADYYGLAGIFKSTRTMEDFKTIAKWWENPVPTPQDLAKKAEHEKEVAAKKVTIQARVDKANADLLEKLKTAAEKAAAAPHPPSSGVPEGPRANNGEAPKTDAVADNAITRTANPAPPATIKLPDKPEDHYEAGTKEELKKLREELAKFEKDKPELPAVMGVTEGKPTDLAIHVRGSHLTLGKVVPRQFPVVISGDKQQPISADRSGRLELARWIASKDNPLTARVMVNRVWRWHFGRGIVRTPDNFGKLGEAPTHPQLIDWLASRFIEDGWSVKKLHKRIMLSHTYQQSSEHDAEAARLDPDNRLYSRAPIRRLEAEAIRDAILFVSGRLDPTMTGPAITHVRNREFLFDHTSKDGTKYDTTRRSVYLPVVRNHLYDFFELFDFPDSATPQGDRPTTTIAPQALLALNSPLIWESAGKMADGIIAGSDEVVLHKLFVTLIGRPPTALETRRNEAWINHVKLGAGDKSAHKRAWQTYIQTLLVSNEFMYVR